MADIVDAIVQGVKLILEQNRQWTEESEDDGEIIGAVADSEDSEDSNCVCDACVICTSATPDSTPLHMKRTDDVVHIGGISQLTREDIEIDGHFKNCMRTVDNECCIGPEYVEGGEWQDADDSYDMGARREMLNRDKSYMICTKGPGLIYFHSDGQDLDSMIDGIYYLSDEYMSWLVTAEGLELKPYKNEEDSQEMKRVCNVTLGIGITFDNTKRNWDILERVLGWSEEDIESIIYDLYYGHGIEAENYVITEEQAYELFDILVADTYMPNLNKAIMAFNEQNGYVTNYSQRQLEAMFDFSYNNGLSPTGDTGGQYSGLINNPEYIIYYYLRNDLEGAVDAIKRHNSDGRRRLNQMNLFFFDYDFLDSSQEGLNPLREKLGFFNN